MTSPIPVKPRFDGPEYIPHVDDFRLTGQLNRVWTIMRDQKWRTLGELAKLSGDPESSISAQLRHLRKDRFGKHTVEKRRRSPGLFEYRVTPAVPQRDLFQ